MSPFSRQSRSKLSQQFAEIFQTSQEEYRGLLTDLRDDDIDVAEFAARAEAQLDRLIKLKRIRVQLHHEREELSKAESSELHGHGDAYPGTAA